MKKSHLLWIPAGGAVGFIASWVFGDLLRLPLDIYYLIYFFIVTTFLFFYVKRTNFDLRKWISNNLIWGIILGIIVGFLMLKNVLSRPATDQFTGFTLWWEILWRGVIYGLVDGILLFSFPWIVTWRAFKAKSKKIWGKVGIGAIAWLFTLLITTAYHLGYADFRSKKIIQPNIGSVITSVPTLFTANPIASPISHVFLHVTAVVHSPETDLFLPPHREED
ncbi:MAG: hypothetical protein ACNS62_11200 [Candidatus Cyclobacteriaceae bacterium M3_2C_046]